MHWEVRTGTFVPVSYLNEYETSADKSKGDFIIIRIGTMMRNELHQIFWVDDRLKQTLVTYVLFGIIWSFY